MMLPTTIVTHIKSIVGEEYCKTDVAEIYSYGFDASIYHATPDIIVRPGNKYEISEILKVANEHKIPVIPRGAGSALCGHTIPIHGGIIVDMCRMTKIKEIKVTDLYCVVEPGVINDKLNDALKPYNFWFPPTPGSGAWCTIGGMVSTNASGMRAIKYGATRDYVLGLEVVLPTSEIIHCGTKTIKNASGYQLEKMFIGSEGTLGIITEITLRVVPLPHKCAAILATFDSLEKAGQCVSNIIAKPVIPSAIEIMDKVCVDALNTAMRVGFPECTALLFIEVDGHKLVVKDELNTVVNICKESGATTTESTDDPKIMGKWTEGRKALFPALSRMGDLISVTLADDMAVPISKIALIIKKILEISAHTNVLIGTCGHAGDGNLHTRVLIDPTDITHWENAEKALNQIYDAIIEVGGTVTGEHGVSISKAPYMRKEREDSINVMKKIKKALDPNNIMNPGKIYEWEKGIISSLRYPIKK